MMIIGPWGGDPLPDIASLCQPPSSSLSPAQWLQAAHAQALIESQEKVLGAAEQEERTNPKKWKDSNFQVS